MVNTAHASDSPENAQREMNVLKMHSNTCWQILDTYLKTNNA
jgi:hypothetical protein